MTTLAVALLTVSFVVTAAWPVHYHLTTRGGWWRDGGRPNPYGRNLMGLAVVFALLQGFTLASTWVPYQVLVFVAVVLWTGAIVVIGHRHVLLWRSQHRRP